MKNVLIVATTSYAGMGPYVSEIINTFTINDGIFFLLRDYEDDFFLKNIKKELHPLCYFYKQANSKWNKIKTLFAEDKHFKQILSSLCCQHNIGVAHFICDPAPIDAAKLIERRGISIIGTVHDLHPHEAKKIFYKMLRHRILDKKRWQNTNYGKILITNSMTQFKELTHLFPEKKIYYHAFPSLVTKEIIDGSDIPDELSNITKPYILFFGRIEEYKGLSLLYEGYISNSKISDSYNLVIAGKGALNIEGINNTKGVILINRYVKDSEVKFLYKNASCIVYPYLSATQSGVLSLAFYFGKPTLASDISFFYDTIAPYGVGMLFKTGSSKDLSEKLLKLLSTDTEKMGEKAQNIYSALYDTLSIREKLLEIYKISCDNYNERCS